MRAIQLVSPGKVEVRDVPLPEIGPDEVLVKVAGAGLCHSDLHLLHLEMELPPMTLGHETAGYVASRGDLVSGFAEGDPVLICVVWGCGVCRPCVEGRDNVCVSGGRMGTPPCPGLGPDGGMAEYIKVKARYLEPLGSLDPVRAAPLADAGLTPMHAVNGARHRLTPGSSAVVIGVGGLGHVAVQILRQTSATMVIAVDVSQDRLELARSLGADEAIANDPATAEHILAMTNEYGADAVFDFVGAQATVDLATRIIAPDGALRFVGLGGGSFAFSSGLFSEPLPWGVDVRRSYGGTRNDQRQVIEMAALGKIQIKTTTYALDNAAQAFEDLESGRIPGRAVLVP